MKNRLRIVGHPPAREERNSGRLMYEALRFMQEADTSFIPGEMVVPWRSVKDLLELLQENFTAREPSVRDQAALMVTVASLVTGKADDMPTTIEGAAQRIMEPLGLTFQTDAAIRWFDDSPDAGDPLCICSYCEEVITEEDAPPIRLFDSKKEARFHTECFQTCDTYNLLPDNSEPTIGAFRGLPDEK